MFSSLMYISNPFSTLLGAVMLVLFVGYFCYRVNDNSPSSKSSYRPPKRNYSSRDYDDTEYNYNWDDSWDDKWLHQGKYADNDDSHEEYADYDLSWDEHFRK